VTKPGHSASLGALCSLGAGSVSAMAIFATGVSLSRIDLSSALARRYSARPLSTPEPLPLGSWLEDRCYNAPPRLPPIIGATRTAKVVPLQPPTKIAGPVLRAGFTRDL